MSQLYAEPLQQIDRTYVLWRGRKLIYFAGCDYLRLSSHPKVLRALQKSLVQFGLNVAASRKTTGNHHLYLELESSIRKFFRSDAAVLSSTGYFTNIIAAQGLRGSIDYVFIDERAHGSLRDAARFLGCPASEFTHRNPGDLQKKVASTNARFAVLTDGMFSHDGSIAPLSAYRRTIGPDALLWVDDAHAGGIIGLHGRGTVELEKVPRRNLLQTVTFSKAFGTYGGAILCDKKMAALISERSCAVGGNTPTPLPLVAATLTALDLCNDRLRAQLFKNIELFWKYLGHPLPEHPTPIISLAPDKPASLSRQLLAAGIYPPHIKYPGGPAAGYFRFAISSEHSSAQIKKLATVLAEHATSLLK
jgi:7-keto-8-aminopelargonate synthetase-like enzyme